ncbi:hypothetical protein JVT61DRAFT_3897 [Boletus reticuloceps]|uniref:Integrase core domain-containing protein n=1 Tax=Boletus reticuloceps TaxID=495285 RepID=A0A8I2YMY8_9AGAM|nr:hypothetical protein JVT61DRAFT_3897 [Boletus reticuloceps]
MPGPDRQWHLGPGQAFPPLPARDYWSPDIHHAHEILQDAYQHAVGLLQQEDGDPLRIRIHADQISQQMVPLLEALHHEVGDINWTMLCVETFGELLCMLENVALSTSGQDQSTSNLIHIVPVVSEPPGPYQGCPRLKFDAEWLLDAVSSSHRIPLQTLAQTLGVHRNTLRCHLRMVGLSKKYSDITDEELEICIRRYKCDRPNAGLQFVITFLKSHGIHVQRARIQSSMQRINPLGRLIRYQAAIKRRVYESPQSNYVWHINGHHKLICWGVVVGLQANIDNRAQTVLNLFLTAIEIYGTPTCVCGDRGGKNMDVAVWMIRHCGPNQSSFLWGRSTQNSHIERLWVDTGTNFVHLWKAFFIRLEDIHMLDVGNPHHLWLLHYLFLGLLNDDCQRFQLDWNHHPILKQGHNQSPLDMRFLSATQHGIYAEPEAQRGPDIAGHSDDGINLEAEIMAEQSRHVRHAAINVPLTASPFHTTQAFNVFRLAFQETQERDIVPLGYGVAKDEWTGSSYPEIEVITVGRGKREYVVELPFEVWWTRVYNSLAENVIFVALSSTSPSHPMSPNSESLESSGPCSWFIAGAGRKGDRCSTCYKKERHHRVSTDPPQAASSNLPPHSSSSTNTPNSTLQTTTSAPPSTTDNTVQAIINRYAGGTGMQLHSRAAVTTKSEAFSGFWKKTSSSFPKSRKVGCQTRSTSHPPHQEKQIKIGTLLMVPHGLNESVSKKPTKSELESYRQVGLMVGADGEDDLEFNISWSMVDIDLWFWCLLPKPFEWLDACHSVLDIHWVLLNSDRQMYFVLTQPTITGKELDQVRGTPGRKFTLHSIVICTACSSAIPHMPTIWKALSCGAPSGPTGNGDIIDISTVNDLEVDDAMEDISEYCSDPSGTTQAQIGLKRHASTLFETNASQAQGSSSVSGPSKRIKSDHYHARMSPVHKLGTSVSSEFPQATTSGPSTVPPMDRRLSALRPAHKPSRNPWA